MWHLTAALIFTVLSDRESTRAMAFVQYREHLIDKHRVYISKLFDLRGGNSKVHEALKALSQSVRECERVIPQEQVKTLKMVSFFVEWDNSDQFPAVDGYPCGRPCYVPKSTKYYRDVAKRGAIEVSAIHQLNSSTATRQWSWSGKERRLGSK
jgi:hypothetical protein